MERKGHPSKEPAGTLPAGPAAPGLSAHKEEEEVTGTPRRGCAPSGGLPEQTERVQPPAKKGDNQPLLQEQIPLCVLRVGHHYR